MREAPVDEPRSSPVSTSFTVSGSDDGKAAVPFPTMEISARRNSINNNVRIRRYGPPMPRVPIDSPRQQ